MRKGQVIVENALVFWVFILMVVATYTSAVLVEKYSVAQLSSVAVCEMYAETNNISGVWKARIENYIPLLDQKYPISGPRMDITVGGFDMHYDETVGGTLLMPIPFRFVHPQITCVTHYRIFAARIPLLGQIDIVGNASYTTNRRYGSLTSLRPRFPLHTFAPLPLLPVGLVVRRFRKQAKNERGQAITEYAIIVSTLMIPVLICAWSIAVTLDAVNLATWGGLSLSAAALGPNQALVDVAFSWGNGNNSCSFTAGQAMDCNAGSPYSPLGENPGIPTISLSSGFVSMQIGEVY